MARVSPRLSRQARRQQLLDTSLAIVRTEGADGLSLPTLAEAAGVSRPIVYDHFGTRSDLLVALYRQLSDRMRTVSTEALVDAAPTAAATARVLSTSFLVCLNEVPEWHAIAAALKGNPELDAIEGGLCDLYAEVMVDALAPYSSLNLDDLRLRCFGAMGAADAIGTELNRGRTDIAKAVTALTALILGSVTVHAEVH
ncbi:AcrR family transcriptional regulator [Rhodococcus erythropolis]|uniref:TetR/AcrR family transcriptional regulator n=1 Tax=Rhodococcus erythropolis group TaxID=2840174 RepID=UPI002167AB04|nr:MULTISPECIES: TetR/AcrR family transcriptional regulator [Rhodococcus erythropolis group]MCS4255892.1 AcrR family transcriptional regulator [Rhodococcus erythropolis]MCW2425409.1 AcrR family transcriptional regulator [Rhodococcus erythropolis]MDJ0490254.1 TetR/AcrR family transcriptional regulator [Rhodococcus qingshengii]